MKCKWQLFWLSILLLGVQSTIEESLGDHDDSDGKERENKLIFYDVNPGEGFNLRRDVFMRMAVFVRNLNRRLRDDDVTSSSSNVTYTLVLPPWGRLYHWQSRELGAQERIPWSHFFDVASINRFVPVIEVEDLLANNLQQQQENGAAVVIDQVFYLQGYSEGWSDGGFEEKFDYRDCIDPMQHLPYRKKKDSASWRGYFWGFGNKIEAKEFRCLSVQGMTSVLNPLLLGEQQFDGKQSVMLDRAENLLHEEFGGVDYWMARRSMRFAANLIKVADEFRQTHLDSNDLADDTVVAGTNWEDHRPDRSGSRGGPYACVHLRRKDFVESRANQIPSLKGAAEQLKRKLAARGLNKLYVATDAPAREYRQLKSLIEEEEEDGYSVFRFGPDAALKAELKDGGVAIVDQIICSHAKYFVGSHESTFTFRIQEEREIMGFEPKNTFDMMCADGKFDCQKGSQWKIKYPSQPNNNRYSNKNEL